MIFDDTEAEFVVLMNEEEQFSLWPSYLAAPDGWSPAGVSGRKADCVAYIERVWTDMRPRSVRERQFAS